MDEHELQKPIKGDVTVTQDEPNSSPKGSGELGNVSHAYAGSYGNGASANKGLVEQTRIRVRAFHLAPLTYFLSNTAYF